MVAMTGFITDGFRSPASFHLISDRRLAECGCGAKLAGDGEDDEVGTVAVVVGGGDDGGGSLLGGGLVGEGERDQDEVSELKAGHSRRRRGYPRPWRTHPRRAWRRPG